MLKIFENVRSLWIIFIFDRLIKRILMHSHVCPTQFFPFYLVV